MLAQNWLAGGEQTGGKLVRKCPRFPLDFATYRWAALVWLARRLLSECSISVPSLPKGIQQWLKIAIQELLYWREVAIKPMICETFLWQVVGADLRPWCIEQQRCSVTKWAGGDTLPRCRDTLTDHQHG